jgi:hypothetical protein
LYCSPGITKLIKLRRKGGKGGMYVKEEKCSFLVTKPAGRRPLGRLTRTLEDNIKMDIRDGTGVD